MNKYAVLFNLKKILEYRPVTTIINAEGKNVPKRKNFENRITLIGTDNSVSIIDLKNAQNLSVKRELKLVKVQDVDVKTRRPIYKLMTNAEFHEEELERRKEKKLARQNSSVKGQKLMILSSKISEHDLMTSVRKMGKLVEKQYEVKVVLAGEGGQSSQVLENIYSVIEKNTKSTARLLQKRNKGNSLKFQLLPLNNSNMEASQSDNSEDGNDKGPL
ncbi:uncharacterized protein LOC114245322 [Bombyx mandarina]|uniref:Uncharacterized protein LOC114245322 n=1 Tax=Bombyx mandarina TaxID=7092 RepID=A0A6J2JV92_BOMMA|nr:uncharacterized protein LOC114245322 [Bombyx mandarina]